MDTKIIPLSLICFYSLDILDIRDQICHPKLTWCLCVGSNCSPGTCISASEHAHFSRTFGVQSPKPQCNSQTSGREVFLHLSHLWGPI